MTLSLPSFIPSQDIIGCSVTALPFQSQIQLMLQWANQRLSKVVCVANVHMLVEASWDPGLASVVDRADLVTPDGMPLVWMMKLKGIWEQDRVAGMDILLALCEQAANKNVSVFFLGSHEAILQKIEERLKRDFPELTLAGMEPLPFRPLSPAEDEAIVRRINESGAGFVFVSLGCPKQELWMGRQKGKVHAVMIGLGGVFPVYAGIHKRAPSIVREFGFEWLYRLIQEPTRLWGRYSKTIPPFIYLATKQLIADKLICSTNQSSNS
jgi:N-acetylglucosaminyldiphosphoundecaprenol N-acetyl-beta-D-mannosaminyltransferase